MTFLDPLLSFIIAGMSFWVTSKVTRNNFNASWSAIFAGSAFYALFGLLFLSLPWGIVLPKGFHVPWLFFLDGLGLPIFILWFGSVFLGFKVKNYFKVVPSFILFTIVGVAITQLFSFLGLGLFCGGGYYVGNRYRPYAFHDGYDYY